MDKKVWIVIVIIAAMLVALFVYVNNNSIKIEEITVDEINDYVSKNNYSLIYFGELTSKVKQYMKTYYKDYLIVPYNISDITQDEVDELMDSYKLNRLENYGFVIYLKDEAVYSTEAAITDSEMREQLDKYLHNVIPESERYYKVLDTADDYIKKVNSKNYTVAVFGYDSCSYCNLYLPIINQVAKDNNINIYYFDKETYDSTEYNKILKLDFEIPAKCTLDGASTKLSYDEFPKPMTIITKGGKFVDCIRGYVTEAVLTDKLKEYKIV